MASNKICSISRIHLFVKFFLVHKRLLKRVVFISRQKNLKKCLFLYLLTPKYSLAGNYPLFISEETQYFNRNGDKNGDVSFKFKWRSRLNSTSLSHFSLCQLQIFCCSRCTSFSRCWAITHRSSPLQTMV